LVPKKEERFKATKYKDLWAVILWVVFLIGLAVISYLGVSRLQQPASGTTRPPPTNTGSIDFRLSDSDIGIAVASTVVTGFVLSLLYFLAMQKFAGTLIKVTLVMAIAFNFVLAGVFFYLRQYPTAIIWLIFGAIYAWCYWSWRHRIVFFINVAICQIDVEDCYFDYQEVSCFDCCRGCWFDCAVCIRCLVVGYFDWFIETCQ
jgi:hypothetical protein